MALCPYCDHENIDGVDVCDQCQLPLSEMYLTAPATFVERSILRDRINVLQPKMPVAVAPTTPVREVLNLLVERRIGCALVVEDGQVIGIFTERDALRKLNVDAAQLGNHPVAEFMTPHPQTLDPAAKIAFAIQRMDQGGFRHVPIVDKGGAMVGVISVRDILRFLTEKMKVI